MNSFVISRSGKAPKRRRSGFSVLLIALAFIAGNAGSLCASQEPMQSREVESRLSIVFVVDVSTSMYDIIDGLRRALANYMQESVPGQSVAVVTFGTNTRLLYRATIRSDADVSKMLDFCEKLSCPDEYTYITAGLNAGLSELHRFYKENPSGDHVLVLMSDGKHHPPPFVDSTSMVTYDDIRQKFFKEFKPGKDWYINYVALKGVPDMELADFVRECRGTTVELHAENRLKWRDFAGSESGLADRQFALSTIISEARIYPGHGLKVDENNVIMLGNAALPVRVSVPLFIQLIKGKAAGQSISVKPSLHEATAGTRLLAEIIPSQVVCSSNATKAEITLAIDGTWEKEILGSLLFEPIGETIFIVHPPQLQFKFDKPPRVLIGRYNPALKDSEWKPIDWLALGPLEPGKKVEESLTLKFESSLPSRDIEIETVPEIRLPDGVTCTSTAKLRMGVLGGKEARVLVTAEAAQYARLPQGWKIDGNLIMKSAAGLSFSPNPVPLRVFSEKATKNGTWRGRAVSYYRELRPPQWIAKNWRAVGSVVGGIALPAMLIGARGYLRWRAYMSKFVPAEGWLIVLEKARDAQADNIDLKELSEKLKKAKLTIGREPGCEIPIPHKSVDKRHAEIRSGREGTPTPVYIKSLGLSDVKVNNFCIDKEVKLNDRDVVRIGDFEFFYSNSHLKQVVVHYKDGDVKYGVPLTWNIEDDGFLLRPENKAAGELQIFVPFRDLKGVFFVKHFDKEIARKMKVANLYAKRDRVMVEFLDGEKFDGFTMQEYSDHAPRFFVVPKTDPGKEENTICALVERQFTKKIELLSRPE